MMVLGGGVAVTTVGGVAAVITGTLRGLSGGSAGSDGEDDPGGANDDGSGPATADGGDDTVISVGSTRISSGETDTVPVTLESAPNGMSGFKLAVGVDTAVAAITDGTIADEVSALSTVTVADDGSSVTLKAAGRIEAGATDVQLATVTTRGADAGTTALESTVELFDDADGTARSPETLDGEVAVE